MSNRPLTQNNLLIAVMSYNMGPLLRNCLESISSLCEGIAVRVYDDRSNDPETQRVLDEFGHIWPIIVSRNDSDLVHWKTGNLWANMNAAMEFAVDNGYRYVLYIQDDMQIVRRLDDPVFDEYSQIFASKPNIAQVRCLFMKHPAINPEHASQNWVRPDRSAYFVRTPEPYGVLATGIVDVAMLAESGYKFIGGEMENSKKTRALGWHSVFAANPISPQLPWPPTMNNNRLPFLKRIAQRVTDWYYRVGYHPFRTMTTDEVEKMISRPPGELPYAESFLTLAGSRQVTKPWYYERSYAYPMLMCRHWLAKKKVEANS